MTFYYGVRYLGGHVAEFGEDRAEAFAEARRLALKGTTGIKVVRQKVGEWRVVARREWSEADEPAV